MEKGGESASSSLPSLISSFCDREAHYFQRPIFWLELISQAAISMTDRDNPQTVKEKESVQKSLFCYNSSVDKDLVDKEWTIKKDQDTSFGIRRYLRRTPCLSLPFNFTTFQLFNRSRTS